MQCFLMFDKDYIVLMRSLNSMQIVGFLHFPLSFKYTEITKEFRRHGNHIIEVGIKRMYLTVCQLYSLSSCTFLVDCFMFVSPDTVPSFHIKFHCFLIDNGIG